MFLSRVKMFVTESTKKLSCSFISQSAKESRRSISCLSSSRNILNSAQVTHYRSMFLSSRLQKGVTITFLKDDGTEVKRRARIGDTLQDLVKENDPEIPGYGVCGGVTACSTCHVVFPKEIFDKLEPATSEEEDLLDFAPDNCETSRLGCNVVITEAMDGVVVRVPSAKKDQRP